MKKILWINPVGIDLFNNNIETYLKSKKEKNTTIRVISLDRGPHHLAYYYYKILVLPDTLTLIKWAEKDGYDAVIIGCFGDPGLTEAREITERIIVVAPGQTSMSIASMLGNRFSIILGKDKWKWITKISENLIKYGFKDKLASFKSINLDLNDLHKNPKITISKLKKLAREAVEKDGAEVIILGCTLQFGFYKELQDYIHVPVIDPVLAPFKYAEFLIELKNRMNWIHSKVGQYKSPPLIELKNFDLESQYNLKSYWE